MSDSLRLTIVFEPDESGWIVASIPEVPGAHSQGRTRHEARENVIDALHGILELRSESTPVRARRDDLRSSQFRTAGLR